MTRPWNGQTVLRLVPGAVRPLIAGYLNSLAAALPAPRRTRHAVVAEVADGLIETVDAHIRAGAPPPVAARAAVAEFGDPANLAAALSGELAGRTAHRIGLGLLVTGPIVGVTWVTAFTQRTGLGLFEQIPAMWTAVPLLAVMLAITVPAAILAAAAGAGSITTRLPIGPRGAAAGAILAAAGCLACDTALLTGLATTGGWTSLAVPAAVVSLLRLVATGAAARRCVALRAAAA